MTLDELRQMRDSESLRPILLTLDDGRQLTVESPRYLGITPKGVVLVVSTRGTFWLAPEQIKEARGVRVAG